MTIQETSAIMDVLSVAYPQFYKSQDDDDRFMAARLWAEMFKDDNPAIVTAAVKAFIASDTKGFPPSIGSIKDRVYKLSQPQEMTEMEAWGLVARAIDNGTYGSKTEFEKLPEAIQRVIGSPSALRDWAQMRADTVESVIQSNFMRSYRARTAANREYGMLPESVKEVVGKLSESMSMPALPEADA